MQLIKGQFSCQYMSWLWPEGKFRNSVFIFELFQKSFSEMMKECYPGKFFKIFFTNFLILIIHYCRTGADTEKLSKHIWRMYDTNKVLFENNFKGTFQCYAPFKQVRHVILTIYIDGASYGFTSLFFLRHLTSYSP